jgi:hypothetical protein
VWVLPVPDGSTRREYGDAAKARQWADFTLKIKAYRQITYLLMFLISLALIWQGASAIRTI